MAFNPTISEPSSMPAVEILAPEQREALTPGQLIWRRFLKHHMALGVESVSS